MKNRKYCIECGKERDGDNPLWCISCDGERKERITKQLEGIADSMGLEVPWRDQEGARAGESD